MRRLLRNRSFSQLPRRAKMTSQCDESRSFFFLLLLASKGRLQPCYKAPSTLRSRSSRTRSGDGEIKEVKVSMID
jgi:hypothetical protein